MKYNSEEANRLQVLQTQETVIPNKSEKSAYEVLNVSGNYYIHEAISDKLRHFSINSRKLSVYQASDLMEAKSILGEHPNMDLIVIDNTLHVNGSYRELLRYMKDDLNNSKCHIAFRDEMPQPVLMSQSASDFQKEDNENDQAEGRERLIDIIRMIMLTCDMEWKLNSHVLPKETTNNEPVGALSGITREKLYTILASDMKEPVGNMTVMLDFLTNEPDLLDPETSRDLLLNVRESIHNIHELLENFLFWTRLHKHDIDFNPVRIDLSQIIRENMMLLKTTAASKHILLKSNITEDVSVYADEYMIITVLRNLIYNAIKYTRKHGTIEINASVYPECAEVKVLDEGNGLTNKEIEKIFSTDEHFKTRITAKASGTGLGLILCKDFVEKNGGRLTIESKKNRGNTFSFTVPCWKTIPTN